MINGIDYYRRYEPVFRHWKIDRLIGEDKAGEIFEISRKAQDGTLCRAAMKTVCIPEADIEFRIQQSGADVAERSREYFDEIVKKIGNECEIMARLGENPNIVMYREHTETRHRNAIGWDIFIRMQPVMTFAEYRNKNGLSENDIIRLGIHICNAVESFHGLGVVHGYIRPDNIFVDEAGNFMLGDSGILKILDEMYSGIAKPGAAVYTPPEIYSGKAFGATVDVYSLGLFLYELLNHGRAPFMPAYPMELKGDDKDRALLVRMNGTALPYPDGTKNKALCDIVLKACAFDPADRFASAAEMKAALEGLADDNSGAAFSPIPVSLPDDGRADIQHEAVGVNGAVASGMTENVGNVAGMTVDGIHIDGISDGGASSGEVSVGADLTGDKRGAPKKAKNGNKSRMVWAVPIAFLLAVLVVLLLLWVFSRKNDDESGQVSDILVSNCSHSETTIEEGKRDGDLIEIKSICVDCGELVGVNVINIKDVCEHTETEVIEGEKKYDKLDWERTDEIRCVTCDTVVDTKTVTGTDICTHTETVVVEGEKQSNGLDWTRVDEKKCVVCEEIIATETVTGRDECKHKDTEVIKGKKNYSGLNWTRTDETKCKVCGEVIDTKTVSGKDECSHSSTKVVQGKKVYSDGVNWTRTDKTVCSKCNTTISTKTVKGTDNCSHKNKRTIYGEKIQTGNNSWKRTNRQECADCGAFLGNFEEFGENECPHLSTYIDQTSAPGYLRTICVDCGKVLDNNFIGNN